jgi:hypothetical protein
MSGKITQWPLSVQRGIRVWVSPRARLEAVQKRKIPYHCIGYLDATLSCPFTTNLSYINKSYDQYGVMVSSFEAAPVILTSK